jgi:hypothetical protein
MDSDYPFGIFKLFLMDFFLFCTDGQNVKRFNWQPSENDLQHARMVIGGLPSFKPPFQDPDGNLPHPQPHYHSGYSDEDDSGFH